MRDFSDDFGPDINAAWRATHVQRWHAYPEMARSYDSIAAHSGRVALLVSLLFPGASADLLTAAIWHDLGECGLGDVSAQAKDADPELRALLDAAEARQMARMGIAMPVLTDDESDALRLCDRLDGWLWQMFIRGHGRANWNWSGDLYKCAPLAMSLGVSGAVMALARGAARFSFEEHEKLSRILIWGAQDE